MTELVPSFDLLTEHWIPCMNQQGDMEDISVLDVFRRAHELRGIADSSPLVTCALYRFLEAVLHQSLDLADEEEWAEQWEQPCFSDELIAAIEQTCAGRMNLFDEEHPFYQSGDIPLDETPKNAKTVGYLAPDAATATNIAHFDHDGDADHAFCPICCAKGLITVPPFEIGSGRGCDGVYLKNSINGRPPVYVLPLGATLLQDLLLNYVLPKYRGLVSSPDQGPVWAQNGEVRSMYEPLSIGYTQSLTWSARRMRLFPSVGGECSQCGGKTGVLVRDIWRAQGWRRQDDAPVWLDPWAAYTQSEEKGQLVTRAVRPRKERGLWRDFAVLFLVDVNRQTMRPNVLDQLGYLIDDAALSDDAPVHFDAFAFRFQLGKDIKREWAHDSFNFPAALIGDARAAVSIEAALVRADGMIACISDGLCELHPAMDGVSMAESLPKWRKAAKTAKAALAQTIDLCLRGYWSPLEGVFREQLHSPSLIGTDWDRVTWLAEWRDAVRRHAGDSFDRALESFDSGADDLRRQQRARARFYGSMKKHLGGDL